jgi:hypothetical protein
MANLNDPLVRWRAHVQSVSQQNLDMQRSRAESVATRYAFSVLDGAGISPAVWRVWLKFWAPPRLRETPFSAEEAQQLAGFLPRLAERFYGNRPSDDTVRQHRRATYRGWSRHALALALRAAPGRGLASRLYFARVAAAFFLKAALP